MTLLKTHVNRIKILVLAAALLHVAPASAGQELSSLSRAQLSRDLVQPTSQEFFRQGKERLEGEIRILQGRRLSAKPILNVDQLRQKEKDR